jgi:sulfide:quinone oxidoreductase
LPHRHALDHALVAGRGARGTPLPSILAATKAAGYDMAGVVRRIANGGKTPTDVGRRQHDIVIVGGRFAAGISVASSLLKPGRRARHRHHRPADIHYYQPGWTMVGGGIFEPEVTARTMGSLIPRGVHLDQGRRVGLRTRNNALILDGCRVVKYNRLIVAPASSWTGTRSKGWSTRSAATA